MPSSSIHVLVIGGGLGGLCLAQGLKQAHVSVAVYERDRTPNDRLQGYRIHIEPQGNRALAACLPADLFKSYLATSAPGGTGFRIATEQLDELCFFRAPAATNTDDLNKLDLSVSRITLREILLSGLEEIVHYSKTFSHYVERADGKLEAYFDDGTSAIGDVLIAADGVKSRVRRQFLPQAQTLATGVVAVMGKVPLTAEIRKLLIPGQFDGATSVLGPNGQAMFVAIHDQNELSDYLFWAFLARQEKYKAGEGLRQMDGVALQQVVSAMTQGWHPRLRQLICSTDPSTVICKPLYTSVPIQPWATKRVTLLGDAIHSMPPTRGIGGNTALRDAHLLCQQLITAKAGEKPLHAAIHAYEAEMIKYGFAAVRSSMQALALHVGEHRLLTKAMLRSMNALFLMQRTVLRKAA